MGGPVVYQKSKCSLTRCPSSGGILSVGWLESDVKEGKRPMTALESRVPFASTLAMLIAGALGCAGGDGAARMQRLESENATLRRTIGGPNAYDCKVLEVKELQDDGKLVEAAAAFRAQSVGATFVVNRETGVITGAVGGNGNFDTWTVTFTPPDNPFYVVSTTRSPHRNVEYLSVRDWAEGQDKPFVLAESSHVFSGVCRR